MLHQVLDVQQKQAHTFMGPNTMFLCWAWSHDTTSTKGQAPVPHSRATNPHMLTIR